MTSDWLTIKNDYINGGGSYRKLAEKYGVSASTLMQRAAKEKWNAEKQVHQSRTEAKTKQKAEDKISDALSDEAASKAKIRAKLIRLVEKWVDNQEEEITDTGDFRRIVQSCVDLGIMKEDASQDAIEKLDEVLDQIGGVI